MTSILTRENLDLIALQLDRAGRVEQVTGLELLKHFESIDGFWNACVKMVTPTSAELSNLLKNTDEASVWLNGSMEQIIEIGIRDHDGNLTASFCNWFDKNCELVPVSGTRNFLLPHLRPTKFAQLTSEPDESSIGDTARKPPNQLQTKFTDAVIQHMNIAATMKASDIYPDFAQKAVELADEQLWGQDLTVEIETGTGNLLISYTTTGSAARVTKKVTPRRFSTLLSQNRKRGR